MSEETKLIIEDRKALKEESVKTGEKVLELEAKRLGKEIKKAILEDEKRYYEKDFGDNVDVTTAWRTANEIMGSNKNLAPTAIKTVNEKGETEFETSPRKLSEIFNKFFVEKVRKLRARTDHPPKIEPKERLEKWLTDKGIDLPPFQFKQIDRKTFRGIMKKMKGNRVHGVD